MSHFLQLMGNWSWEEINPVFVVKLTLNLIAVGILSWLIYLKHHKRSDLILTFFAFNTIVFLISYLLNRVDLSTGAAFGLFAIFSMLRYRTEGISARDMTYLFLSIAIGLIMAVSTGTFFEHVVLAGFILLLTSVLERGFFATQTSVISIVYEKPELIHPSKRKELLDDLHARTGLTIRHIEIGDIDYLKDAVVIKVYHELR
ncbi:MAG: DUF4956 domain-containing protein [Bacteroidetes bacterium]|nr:DUF4956 domain-containing protein [Bacteroidota bacterium]